VKIASVSVPDELFERADDVAARLGLNRSQMYARALEQFLDTQGVDPVTAMLGELAGETGTDAGAVAGRRLVDQGAWQW